uniref:Integrase, catalytic region, zinc finger, CCHC-type, peptidase aspartic, catalytic n=1 Tax=Tanacetum cinerariifolium TaxID=118510 RepID=A0A6L2NI86_TANCI|nr:integrase, catalytic region, zinc finger, CCHC-type, peptidase aspartic, catalytic [Tanacetum cinerariifolium]
MANLSEDIQCAGLDTGPLMLDRTDFASWQQRIRLYCRSKDNGVNILKFIDEGPYKLGTFRETLAESTKGTPQFGLERPRVYSDLKSEEKDRYNADIRATNILLQGLPKDIYTLINYYTDAIDIWDNVKMLLEGSELTKEDRESQLYDHFEHFKQHKEDSIHDYYVRFAKLINDMRNIKMTMSKLQLNSKFVNNMLPEWGRFVTVVKLNRGLRDSNYDQLFAYLKQHEAHAMENKMLLERLSQPTANPLALLSNVSNTQHGSPSSSTSPFTQLPPPRANSRYGEAQNKVRNVNQGQARPGQARTVKCYKCNGTGHIAQNYTQPKRQQNSKYFKDKMLLMQAQENGVALDVEQFLFLAGRLDNAFDDDVDEQLVQDLALNVDNMFQAEDCDAFDSDVDEAPTTQTMFMANLSLADPVIDEVRPSYDSDILSKVHDHDKYVDDTCAYQEEHVMHDSVQLDHIVDLHADYTSVSNMISYDQYVKDNEVPVIHSNTSSVLNDTFMMMYDDMCETSAPSVSNSSRNAVVKNSLTAELATYREQVELYERRAKFKLTKRE